MSGFCHRITFATAAATATATVSASAAAEVQVQVEVVVVAVVQVPSMWSWYSVGSCPVYKLCLFSLAPAVALSPSDRSIDWPCHLHSVSQCEKRGKRRWQGETESQYRKRQEIYV